MHYFYEYLNGCWTMLCQISPALLGGFLAAGLISAFLSEDFIRRHLGGGGFKGIAKAALLGVPMPLCSCGVLPVAASLKRSGASAGAIVAFLISVPQTGADNILVVWSLLGPLFALYSPVSAFLSGLFGGALCEYFGSGLKKEPQPVKETEAAASKPKGLEGMLKYAFVTLVDDLAGAILLGIAIAGLVSVAIPDGWLAEHAGPGLGSMAFMLLIGIPLYVCSSGSVPIAAAFMAKGASPGAALVFLTTGPVSNAAGIAAISKMLGLRTAVLYLASIAAFAFGSGLLLNELYARFPAFAGSAQAAHAHNDGQIDILSVASAVSLLSLLLLSMLKSLLKRILGDSELSNDGSLMIVKVKGMTCNHCAGAVEAALAKLPGVLSVQADFKKGEAGMLLKDPLSPPSFEKVKSVVEELGYQCYKD